MAFYITRHVYGHFETKNLTFRRTDIIRKQCNPVQFLTMSDVKVMDKTYRNRQNDYIPMYEPSTNGWYKNI